MKNKKLWLGMFVILLVFGMTIVGCDLFKEEDFSGIINGVWYMADYFGIGEKDGTVITIKDGEGILTSVGNTKHSSTGNYLCPYANYVNRGLIDIGDVVFRNIVYTGSEKNSNGSIFRHTWSYDIFYRVDMSYNGDNGGRPEWRNDRKLTYYTKEYSSYPDTLWAGFDNVGVISFRK